MSAPQITFFPPSFDGAIFDFDGTIAATGGIWQQVDRNFLEKRGLEWTPDYAQSLAALGFADGAAYTIERFGLAETPEDICAEWNEMASALYADQVVLRDGVLEYLQALRAAGVPVALATTNDAITLGSLRPRVDVFSLFDACVFGEDVERNKNYPDIYLEAAARIGVSTECCIAFEDIAPALRSAKAAGCNACAVRTYDLDQPWDELCAISDAQLYHWTALELCQNTDEEIG